MRRLISIFLALSAAGVAQDAPADAWRFAVSGDSRNCGDIVMPAIAASVLKSGAQFYWHLGDFRAIYDFDEDMAPPAALHLPAPHLTIISYLKKPGRISSTINCGPSGPWRSSWASATTRRFSRKRTKPISSSLKNI